MDKPAIPAEEAPRLAALRALDVLDTAPEPRFDRLTRLAQRLFGTPIALVSLVDSDRQWFKSRQGLEASETPRDVSFCGHAILGETVFRVPDAILDPRFADNPLVTGPPRVRFYAGAPLHAPSGHRVGTLCVIDREPRAFSEDESEALRELAACVEAELWRTHLLEAAATAAAAAARERSAEQRIRAIVENVVDGIVTIDERGSIREVNGAVERIFGYARDELLGANVKVLMPEPYRDEHDGYLDRYRRTGERRVIGLGREVSGRRKDGSVFPLELAIGELVAGGERLFTGVVRDVSERKDARERLRASMAIRQAILDTASVSIISTDSEGVIQTFNRTAEAWLGYRAEELVGRATPAVFHDAAEVERRAEALSRELGRPVAGFETFVAKARLGGVDGREWTYVAKDGRRLTVHLSVAALRDSVGEITGFLGTAVDVTERKEAERMKSEFVSTVSHELRTPLTSIRGALSLVLGKSGHNLAEKTRKMLEMAERNSERLTLLINDLLDLDKLEAGRLELELRGLDLVALTARAAEDGEGFARRHQVTLAHSSKVNVALVRGDQHRLLQVFSNLISNAVKYSPPGGRVEIGVQPLGESYRVSFRDHGEGIPEHFRQRIFQRFAQADSSDSREKGGTGLGLSIAKAIVERHDGSLSYETATGEGTVFFVDLPALVESRVSSGGEGPRALICEDSPDVARVLEAMLGEEGLLADVAATATGARRLLAARAYALLLLDLTLPDGDGLQLLRELRSDPATQGVPVVVVSGRAREGKALAGGGLSVVDWLPKPVDRGQLARALRAALGRVDARPRILHVEDDPDVVEVTRGLLEDFADLVHAPTKASALELLGAEPFAMVLLDLNLGDGSGADLLDALKGRCPVVIFSAEEPSREVARQVEAALTKSQASLDELLATIKRALVAA